MWPISIKLLSNKNLRFQYKFSCAVTNLMYPKFKPFINQSSMPLLVCYEIVMFHWLENLVSSQSVIQVSFQYFYMIHSFSLISLSKNQEPTHYLFKIYFSKKKKKFIFPLKWIIAFVWSEHFYVTIHITTSK